MSSKNPFKTSLVSGAAAGFVFLGLAFGLTDAGNTAAHRFEDQCDRCHLVYPEPSQRGIFVQDIDFLCRQCHELGSANTHPSEVLPSMSVPKELPLDWQGRLSCATCHDIHAADVAQNPNFLRTDRRGREFCRLCHNNLYERGSHQANIRVAHTKSWTPDQHLEASGLLDPVTLDCLSCHSGSVAPAADVTISDLPYMTYTGPGRSHPVGIDYARAAGRNRELRSLENLSPSISLYEGKVGCASCHNPYSEESLMLVMNNRRSALCLECHLK